MKLEDAMTYRQAAEALNVSRARVSQLVAEGELTPVDLSPGRRILSKKDVAKLVKSRQEKARKRFNISA